MELPQTLAEALEALTVARADAQAFNALTAEHTATLAALSATQADLSAAVLAFQTLTAEHTATLATMAAAELDAAARANAIVASLGVDPVAIVAADAVPKTSKELWAEYHALPIQARNEFYLKHRETLRN